MSKDETFERFAVLMNREESPFRKSIEQVCHRIFEHGFFAYFLSIELLYNSKFLPIDYEDLTLDDLKHAFLLLIHSYAICFFIFLIELNSKYILWMRNLDVFLRLLLCKITQYLINFFFL